MWDLGNGHAHKPACSATSVDHVSLPTISNNYGISCLQHPDMLSQGHPKRGKKSVPVPLFPKKARGHSMCATMVGGGWRFAIGSWQLVVGGGWWWLAAVGGW